MGCDSDYLTTGDAARALDRSNDTIRKYDRDGVLRAVRASNGHRLFKRADVEALRKSREAKR
jgi:excisionase family DNA binding protein